MKRNWLLSAAVAVFAVCLAAPAFAGNTVLFSPKTGDVTFPFTPPPKNGVGSIDNMTIGATTPKQVTGTQLLGPWGTYQKNPASIASYRSYLFQNTDAEMLFSPGSTVAYAYITLAAAPGDGMRQCVFSTAAITELHVNANTGQTIANAATTLSAAARTCYTYSTSNTKWDRSQ